MRRVLLQRTGRPDHRRDAVGDLIARTDHEVRPHVFLDRPCRGGRARARRERPAALANPTQLETSSTAKPSLLPRSSAGWARCPRRASPAGSSAKPRQSLMKGARHARKALSTPGRTTRSKVIGLPPPSRVKTHPNAKQVCLSSYDALSSTIAASGYAVRASHRLRCYGAVAELRSGAQRGVSKGVGLDSPPTPFEPFAIRQRAPEGEIPLLPRPGPYLKRQLVGAPSPLPLPS